MKCVLLLLMALTLMSPALSAHAPQFHDFQLVAFSRPFPAPLFALRDLAEQPRQLAEFQGHYVLLNFWATWCTPCLEEMPALEKLYQKLRPHRFVVVAVATDETGAAQVAPFVRKLRLTFPILLDAEQRVSTTYGARDLPASFLLNPKGQVIAAAKGARDWFSAQALSYFEELLQAGPPAQRPSP